MTKENECYAYFTVVGSFDPDEITRRVGVAATESWRKGDRNPRTDRDRNFSRWILRSRLQITASLEAHVRDVLDQLDTNRTAFRQTSVELNGVMQLVGYFFRDYPGLSFERDLIERMAEYSLSMDCDFYSTQVD
jgi:hypothetical protein